MTRIRVLIVEDSPVVRALLTNIIASDSRLEVVGAVESGEEALRVIHDLSPDIITMDIRLPRMTGFETTQRIMAEKPTPIVVVSSSIAAEELNITMNALRAGALTVVEKPVGSRHSDYTAIAQHLCTQLVIMSEVKVVRQRSRSRRLPSQTAPRSVSLLPTPPFAMIGLVASTGGPNALVQVLTALGRAPIPILVVQHITRAFLDGFVTWLGGQTKLEVVSATDRVSPLAGHVYVAPPDVHLELDGGVLRLTDRPPRDGQRPSGTVLLDSMARSLGARGLGVVMTGMGTDGAMGLLAMREAGAHTIAEHAATAVVNGMPGEAVALNAAVEVLPLPNIGPRLRDLASWGR